MLAVLAVLAVGEADGCAWLRAAPLGRFAKVERACARLVGGGRSREGLGTLSEAQMLSICSVAIAVCRDVAEVVQVVERRDRSLSDQLKRACASVPLNLAESDGVSGGNRVQRRRTALGSAREVLACLDVIEAFGYARIDQGVRARLDHVIGVLVKLTR